MCLAIVALDTHPRFAVVVVANRDEFHARPTAPASWWSAEGTEILGGRDLEAGGTWLGVTRAGRWAFVTNVRQGVARDPGAPSRGHLVPRVLSDRDDPHRALVSAIAEAQHYNGFNMMAGEWVRASWGSNRGERGATLSGGIHGLSNAELDTPWPKLVRTKNGVARWMKEGCDDVDALLDLLADRERARDDELPSTGVSLEWERVLSAPFITGDAYGTRCSTVLTIARDGMARLIEQSFDFRGQPTTRIEEKFRVS